MADRKQIIEERAAWAETFRNAPTNAVTRMRRAADLAAAADQESMDDAQAFERQLARDKGARDLFLGRARLDQSQQRIGQTERGMAQRQSNFEATQERLMGVDEFNQNIRLRKAELDELNSQRLMRKELRDADNAATILKQTIAAEDATDELMRNARVGSPDFAQGALRIIASNPLMDPKARASILATARIVGDPDEIQAQLDAMEPEERNRTTVTRNDKGGLSMTTRPPAAQGDGGLAASQKARHDALAARLKQLSTQLGDRSTSGKLTLDEKTRKEVTDNMTAIQAEISSLFGGDSAPPATQSAVAPTTPRPAPKESGTLVIADVIKSGGRALRDPSSGETIFVDKDNNILGRLKPDGGK